MRDRPKPLTKAREDRLLTAIAFADRYAREDAGLHHVRHELIRALAALEGVSVRTMAERYRAAH